MGQIDLPEKIQNRNHISTMEETTKVRLWQVRKTDGAILFNTMPPGEPGKQVWIPRSQIHHVSRDLPLPDGLIPCTVELNLWLANKHGL